MYANQVFLETIAVLKALSAAAASARSEVQQLLVVLEGPAVSDTKPKADTVTINTVSNPATTNTVTPATTNTVTPATVIQPLYHHITVDYDTSSVVQVQPIVDATPTYVII